MQDKDKHLTEEEMEVAISDAINGTFELDLHKADHLVECDDCFVVLHRKIGNDVTC